MNTCTRLLLAIAFAAVASACTTPGGGFFNTNTPADAGERPKQHEQTVRSRLQLTLKDPDSLKDFAVGTPQLSSCAVGIYGPYHGWRVEVAYNAKNSYGAYVGRQTYFFWFHGEALKGVNQNPSYCPEAPSWK